MFGWMAVPEVSEKLEVVRAVVPTLVLPFAAVSLILSALATFIAGLFGVQLKWEGPKKLIEVLLKPRVLLAAVFFNLFLVGGYYGIQYGRGFPAPLWYIKWVNKKDYGNLNKDSRKAIQAKTYTDSIQAWNQIEEAVKPTLVRSVIQKPTSLKQAWKTKLPRGVFAAVTLSGGSVFAGSDDGNTYEISQETGKILRRFYTGTPVTPSPVIWKSRLFIGEGEHTSHHCRIYSFDLKSGELLGAFQTKGHTEGTPFIYEYRGVTTLFVSAGSDGLYAVDPLTLEERWHRKIGHVDSEARVSDGLVFIGTGVEKGYWQRSHRAFALDFLTGKEKWNVNLPESNWMPPVFIGREVCFGTGEIYAKALMGELACYDQVSGKLTHSQVTPAPLLGIPVQWGNKILVSDLAGEVCAFQWPAGEKIWCRKTRGMKTFASVTQAGNGNLFYPTAQDGILVLNKDSGEIVQSWLPQAREGAWVKTYSRVVGGQDAWFIADSSGNVRKLISP